jgi:ABC-type uncharacterized transport system auxiliary subunit
MGDAEVHYLYLAVIAEHDVTRFQVAMNNALPVHVVETLGALINNVDNLVRAERFAPGDVFLQ